MGHVTCPDCGGELVIGSWPFCKDGHAPGFSNVVGDACDITQEHFGVQPEHFTSKQAMARRAKELGLVPFVRHVGEQGSDKNPHTSRWV